MENSSSAVGRGDPETKCQGLWHKLELRMDGTHTHTHPPVPGVGAHQCLRNPELKEMRAPECRLFFKKFENEGMENEREDSRVAEKGDILLWSLRSFCVLSDLERRREFGWSFTLGKRPLGSKVPKNAGGRSSPEKEQREVRVGGGFLKNENTAVGMVSSKQ